jgi:diguanylate cyclase (GGDEF)-like protein/PAS domain S-box-containing protein
MPERSPASSATSAEPGPGTAPEPLAETQIRGLLDGQQDAALVLSARGAVLHANPAAERLFGMTPRGLRGVHLGLPWAPNGSAQVDVLDAQGAPIACELRLQPAPWAGPRARLATLRDVSARTHAEEALRESEERYELAARAANDGLWDWDLASDAMYFSPRWRSMLGAGDDELRGSPEEWFDRVHPEDLERVRAALSAHIEGLTEHFEHEYRMLHKNGSYRWVLCRGLAVRGPDGRATRIAGSQSDVTHRKLAEEQLAHRAFYDPLTNLPNRALFLDRLRHALRRAQRRKDYLFAVLFLDIDRFKVVNDSLGHASGDRLLVTIARRLELALRPGDSVARLGGDEFTVLLDDLRDAADVERVAERIQRELMSPFQIGGQELYASCSIGIALSSTGYAQPEDILRDADTAMYRAKAGGRARHALFDSAMHQRAVLVLQTEADLRRALERDELRVQYQPIVSLSTGAITGVEALVRWEHPERGRVAPGEFIPVAEECGLIVGVDRWVLQHASREVAGWCQRLGRPGAVRLNVNLSPRQLGLSDLPDHVARVLRESGIAPEALRLELTETAMMEQHEAAVLALAALKRLGVQISVDDFGTGYSSLARLHDFPIDSLKVDRSFVEVMGATGQTSRIARTIVLIGRTLGLSVIAEGVETARQLELLRELSCDAAQGYYFSPPLDGEEALELIAGGQRW